MHNFYPDCFSSEHPVLLRKAAKLAIDVCSDCCAYQDGYPDDAEWRVETIYLEADLPEGFERYE